MKMITLASEIKPIFIVLILLAFFGLIVLAVILIKRKIKPLQIKKDEEMSEEERVEEELNRVLVEVDDEEVKKAMDEEAMKNDGKQD